MRRIPILLAALILALGTPTAEAQERYALLIANLSYRDDVGRLTNPQRDVEIIASALKRVGFQDANIVTRHDLTGPELLAAVRDHAARVKAAGKGAWSFFYYSGHGAAPGRTSDISMQGDNFIIPVDADSPQNADFWKRAVKLEDIGKELEQAADAVHFVVFDACRKQLQLPDRALNARGFVPIRWSAQRGQGMLYAFASAPNSEALDGVEGEDNGPYALALSKEITKSGIDHLHLFSNVRTDVYNATGRRQLPWISDGLLELTYIASRPQQTPIPSKEANNAARCEAPPEVKPLEWEPVNDKHRLLFTRSSITLEEPRAGAPTIEDISKNYVHRIAPGSVIQVGKVDGKASWYRYTRDVGSRHERFVPVDDVSLRD